MLGLFVLPAGFGVDVGVISGLGVLGRQPCSSRNVMLRVDRM